MSVDFRGSADGCRVVPIVIVVLDARAGRGDLDLESVFARAFSDVADRT